MAETMKEALAAFDAFSETWGVKYAKAVECLTKDRDALLAFYDFPAEHWKHLRTTDALDKSWIFFAAILWFDCPPAFFRPDRRRGRPPRAAGGQ